MKIALTADLHGMLPVIPTCDMLIIAGDVCPVQDHSLTFQRQWLMTIFADWLEAVDAPTVIGVAGNHDFIAERDVHLMRRLPWTYLCNETADSQRLTIHGTPMSNRFGPWAFMAQEHELAELYRNIPEDTDILVSHGPPYGAGDRVNNNRHSGDPCVGSKALRERITAGIYGCRYVVTGHIHEGYGQYDLGETIVVNASHVNERYEPVNDIVVIEL